MKDVVKNIIYIFSQVCGICRWSSPYLLNTIQTYYLMMSGQVYTLDLIDVVEPLSSFVLQVSIKTLLYFPCNCKSHEVS